MIDVLIENLYYTGNASQTVVPPWGGWLPWHIHHRLLSICSMPHFLTITVWSDTKVWEEGWYQKIVVCGGMYVGCYVGDRFVRRVHSPIPARGEVLYIKVRVHERGISRIFYFILLKSWDFTTAGIIPCNFAKAGISIHLLSFTDFITMNIQMGGTVVPTTERISK